MRALLKKIGLWNFAKEIYYGFGRIKRRIRNTLTPTAYILLYHRIDEVKQDPHLLCVSPQNFRKQIKFLKENFKIIPLVKLVQDIRKGKIENNSIVITFDDGYADNLYNALPILEEFGVPATIFITAGFTGRNAYYWDENSPSEDRGRPMTPDEAKRLSNSRLIEIGAHTLTHPKLAKIDQNSQYNEVLGSKKTLEELAGMPILGLAYPFGGKDSFDQKTIELVKKAGFNYACANIHERATNRSDIYALPRFVVRNWNLDEFKKKLHEFI